MSAFLSIDQYGRPIQQPTTDVQLSTGDAPPDVTAPPAGDLTEGEYVTIPGFNGNPISEWKCP
jgi:hypothetical protein